MSFDDEEIAYLRGQRLARFATVGGDGQPDVVPVGFELDGDRFYIGGLDLPSTRKYRNVAGGNDRVALVVDDIASQTPWSPRSLRVYGTARIVERGPDGGRREYLEVEPTVSWSWNLAGRPLDSGDAIRAHKTVHRSAEPETRPTGGRPSLGNDDADARAAAEAFAAGLQAGHDGRDVDVLNQQFAADVIWGSPFGALVDGYDQLHPIHAEFQRRAPEGPAFRYEVRHVLAPAREVVVAHIARIALDDDGEPLPPTPGPDGPFSEMAMYVLVRRDGDWWLAGGQNTPMRPGGAAPAVTTAPGGRRPGS